jgi:hypothetical protein
MDHGGHFPYLFENLSWTRVIQDSGFRIQDSGFRIQDSGFRIQDSGFRIHQKLRSLSPLSREGVGGTCALFLAPCDRVGGGSQ